MAEENENEQQQGEAGHGHIDRILKMEVPVIVKVAEKKMTMQNVLMLNIGSIIQFDKDAYQHIDLMANNRTIGLGQPVKIGENFGLKIMQIGDVAETIRSLGGGQK
ncbi:MAG: FliM/FliN family flagellar motor switch protein [Phycisphaerae bacterium]|nr:FliM/FliN family flagellar motor switch protein [Phycisphaerae bacterium]